MSVATANQLQREKELQSLSEHISVSIYKGVYCPEELIEQLPNISNPVSEHNSNMINQIQVMNLLLFHSFLVNTTSEHRDVLTHLL